MKKKKEISDKKSNAMELLVEHLASWWEERKVHRQVKDRLFRFLFEKDKEALLQLYNALNGTDYRDASLLEVVTIRSAVYITMKNDIAFLLVGTISLYEHQSTWNPNMPVRFMIYLAEEYQKFIELAEESLYGTKQIQLPTPQCVVFYNGDKNMPEEQTLCLSDAFVNKTVKADVELRVRVININYGNNKTLLEQCSVLKEYAQFVEIARQYTASGADMQQALNAAIEYCIEHDILRDFLREYRAEVLGMLLREFDKKKYERSIRKEGIEEGREEGIAIGIERGRAEGIRQQQEVIIKKLHSKGMSEEEIADLLEISAEQVKEVSQCHN